MILTITLMILLDAMHPPRDFYLTLVRLPHGGREQRAPLYAGCRGDGGAFSARALRRVAFGETRGPDLTTLVCCV